MARLLRVSLQGLGFSRLVSSPALGSVRELYLLKPPGDSLVLLQSRQISRRWYAESAALEESCSSTQSPNDTAGVSMAANQGEISAKPDYETEQKEVLKEASITNDFNEREVTAEESSSKPINDELASLILGKMKGKPNMTNSHKDNGCQTQTEPHSAKAITPQDDSSKSVQDLKWQQVMSSIRRMAAKNRSETAPGDNSSLSKRKESEIKDDFADLDPPQVRGKAGISRISNNPKVSLKAKDDFADLDPPQAGGKAGISRISNNLKLDTNAFRKDYVANDKQKEGQFQGWNQPKEKEARPVSFGFLKSRDVNGTTTRAEMSADRSPPDRTAGFVRDSFSSMKLKDSRLQGWNQQRSKETKPVSFDFLKFPETNGASRVQERTPPNAKEAIPRISSHDSSFPNTGYSVCIQSLPGNSNLALVKDALSIHGEVVGSFKKPSLDGSCSVYIEFKTAEAMDDALAARRLQLDSKAFTIVRADLPITTVVRLSKVSGETTESQLLSICGTYGSLDTIRRRGNGVYDVFYKVRELPNISKILDSLNEVTQNQRRWTALPAPTLHPAVRKDVLKSGEGQAWHGSQLNQTLNRIEVGLDAVSVCFEDLKALISMENELLKK